MKRATMNEGEHVAGREIEQQQATTTRGGTRTPRKMPALAALVLAAPFFSAAGTAAAQGQPDWVPARVLEARSSHAMAYDSARGRVVLFGGQGSSDTWEWDGNDWTLRSPNNSPPARSRHAMAYDSARQHVVLFGPDTWLYTAQPATTLALGTGCASGTNPPILTSRVPYLGNRAFTLELIGARPASACAFGLSTGTQVRPLPPCTLYLSDPIVTMVALTNPSGFAKSPTLAIPTSPTFRGLQLYAQGVVADPQGSALGLTFSAALSVTIGD